MIVLIVDDITDNRVLLRGLLESQGYEILEAGNGLEAFDLARNKPVDLIISDILMPQMDGYSLCMLVKSIADLASVPFVIYTSTYVDPEDEKLAMALGASAYIAKPMEPTDFLKRINEIVETHQHQDITKRDESSYPESELRAIYHATVAKKLDEKIAAERQMQDELIEKERFATAIAETTPALIYLFDVSTNSNLYSNSGMQRLLGYSSEEIRRMGDTLLPDLIHPDDLTRVIKFQETVHGASDDDILSIEYRMKHKNGDWRELHSDERVFKRDDDGTVTQKIGVAQDITDFKRTSEQLQQSVRELNLALDTDKLGFWRLHMATGRLEWNEQQYVIHGIEEVQFDNTVDAWRAFLHPDDIATADAAFSEIADKDVYGVRFRIIRPDGEIRYIEASGSAIKDSNGEITQLIGINTDITEQVETTNKIAAEEARLRKVAEQMPVMLNAVDENGNIILWNNECERITGYSADEVINHPEIWDKLYPDVAYRNMLFNEWLESDELRDRIYTMRAKDGSARHISWSNNSKQVEIPGWFSWAVGQDVTAREEHEVKLHQAAAVFASTAEGITVTDLDGNIVDVNPSFCDITGYAREEIIGKNPRILQSGRHDREFYQTMWRSLTETGSWRGEIWNRNKSGTIYPVLMTINTITNKKNDTTGYVGAFSDITVMKQSQDQLDYLAHHDALTDLPNRLLFNERLQHSIQRARRHDKSLAVMFIDLDRFKNINDSLSHQHGDELLKQVSGRLKAVIRKEDTLARISGDEFILLIEGISTVDDSATTVDKIMSIFVRPFAVMGTEIRMTCSIGISLFPNDGLDSAELLRNADAAMYQAKEEGRNTYQYYSPELTNIAFEHVMVENAIRNALSKDEFYLVFQPQYRLQDQKLVSMEVLLRWQHPDLGLIPPSRFIPIAEQSGQIRNIGAWVLRSACEQGKSWLDQGYEFDRIAVNISGLQIQQDDFIEEFRKVLAETGMPAQHLEVELTETFLMTSTEHAIQSLKILRDEGISISMDDFGTGYSSMSYLKRLPVTNIKIDQSFVRDIPREQDDIEITKAIIAMAASMNLDVIAEGIENEDQLALLTDLNCDYGQGFFLSKPLKADAMARLLIP